MILIEWPALKKVIMKEIKGQRKEADLNYCISAKACGL